MGSFQDDQCSMYEFGRVIESAKCEKSDIRDFIAKWDSGTHSTNSTKSIMMNCSYICPMTNVTAILEVPKKPEDNSDSASHTRTVSS